MIDPHSSRPRVFDESEAGGKYETLVTGLALLKTTLGYCFANTLRNLKNSGEK